MYQTHLYSNQAILWCLSDSGCMDQGFLSRHCTNCLRPNPSLGWLLSLIVYHPEGGHPQALTRLHAVQAHALVQALKFPHPDPVHIANGPGTLAISEGVMFHRLQCGLSARSRDLILVKHPQFSFMDLGVTKRCDKLTLSQQHLFCICVTLLMCVGSKVSSRVVMINQCHKYLAKPRYYLVLHHT